MALTFAYGSNLDRAQMARRCPSATCAGKAELRGWRLRFAGWSSTWRGAVATIEPSAGAKVQGLLWLISLADLGRLDAYEGVPASYRRRQLMVRASGRKLPSLAYIQAERAPGVPSERYLGQIQRAYSALGFDTAPLDAALAASASEALRARRRLISERAEARRWSWPKGSRLVSPPFQYEMFIPEDEAVPCPSCGGQGEALIEEFSYVCPTCRGTGATARRRK